MTINIICETAPGFSFHYKKLAQTVTEQSLDSEGFPYEAEVNLTLVDEKRIHEINLETRQIDAPTDVLSFPMFEKEEIDDMVKNAVWDSASILYSPEYLFPYRYQMHLQIID